MPSPLASKAMWKAVSYVVVIQFFSLLISIYVWEETEYPDELFPPEARGPQEQESQHYIWTQKVPLLMLWYLLLSPFNYHWQCWLERMFPGRQRGSTSTPPLPPRTQSSKAAVEVDSSDEREAELIERLVSQGKVHKVGFSWLNTIIKWALDTFVMNIVWTLLWALWEEGVWRSHVPSTYTRLSITTYIVSHYCLRVFSIDSVGQALVLLVVPAQHRITFLAIFEATTLFFLEAVLQILQPFLSSWIAKTQAEIRQADIARARSDWRSSISAPTHQETS